jgi:8-oxo-dGTP pyrophosphatase MutT (NUDIX family)
VPSVSVCLWNDHGILLAHHPATGVWSTPGGAVEPDETVSDACRREAREELLIDVEPVTVVAVLGPDQVVYPNGDHTAFVTTAFACRSEVQPSYDGDEIDALRWVSAGEADSMLIATWLRPWIDHLARWRFGDPVLFA